MSVSEVVLAALAKRVNELQAAFRTLSKQQGPQGAAGRDGRDGKDGVDGRNGIDGLRGEVGPEGPPGKTGPRGPAGKDGEPGPQGERGPAPDHQWKGSRLRFQKPDGEWGKWTDLRGPAGEGGSSGGTVVLGGGVDFDSLPAATNVRPNGFLVRQGDKWAIATYAQMSSWLGGTGTASFVLTEDGNVLVAENGASISLE